MNLPNQHVEWMAWKPKLKIDWPCPTWCTCIHTRTHTHACIIMLLCHTNTHTHTHSSYMYTTLVGVDEMHGRVYPQLTDLFVHDPHSASDYPMTISKHPIQ